MGKHGQYVSLVFKFQSVISRFLNDLHVYVIRL